MKKTFTESSGTFNKYLVLIITVLSFTFRQFVLGGMIKKVYPALLRNGLKSLLVCLACGLMPSIAKADTPIPTSVVASYNAALQRLTLTVQWTWGSSSNDKIVSAAVFADLNGDNISPTIFDNPATYNSGGNGGFPAGLSARDEFLGQLAISTIEGTAFSSMYPAGDRTDNGIAFQNGFGPTDPRVLFPYGTAGAGTVGSSGTFTMTYDNVNISPTKICVVMYDVHRGDLDKLSGGHSPRSANPGRNDDNSVEKGSGQGTVSCTGLVVLRCAVNKTEAACQTQAAIDASYAAWLASATASGCNGVLTNNSTGAPSAAGGSKTVTFTYTQNSCSNQAAVTTCTATFTVLPCPPAPDLTPNITTIPNIILDTMNFNATIRVQELDNAPTNGSEILVRIIKDSRITFTYDPTLTMIGFTVVQNSAWTYDGTDAFFHIFRTSIIIPANGASTFGFVANFNPGGKSRGKYTMTSSLNSGSGGETKVNNNQDAEVLDYLFR